MKGKILVAGVGNIFLGDDAFGVEVAQRLAHITLPPKVIVKDFGIRSYDLAYALMDDWDLVILADAVPQGDAPGTVYVIEPKLPEDGDPSDAFDAHTMNPVSVLQLVSALGGKVGRLLVVGCEPVSVEADQSGRIGLSQEVEAGVTEAIGVIEDLIKRTVGRPPLDDWKENIMVGKLVKWGTVGATIGLLVYFRGDIQRYVKMKRM